jgi:hypothetical protein
MFTFSETWASFGLSSEILASLIRSHFLILSTLFQVR